MPVFGWFARNVSSAPAEGGDAVGCFGKLPIHADFIRHNVRLRETAALDAWIQEGTSSLARAGGGAWPESCRGFAGCRFVFTGGEQERTVAGTLTASRDRGGRAYPFIIFAALDDPLFRQMPAVVPLYYDDFFARAGEIGAESWGSEPVSLLTGRVDALFRREEAVTRRLLLERQIALLGGVENLPLRETLPSGWDMERLFASVMEALRQVARRGAARVPWGVRFPLPSQGSLAPFVVFWVQLVESALEDRSLRPHFFWNRAGLTFFFRPVPASCLLPVMDPERHEGVLFDPLKEKLPAGWENPDLRRLLGSESSTLLDILYRLGRREMLG